MDEENKPNSINLFKLIEDRSLNLPHSLLDCFYEYRSDLVRNMISSRSASDIFGILSILRDLTYLKNEDPHYPLSLLDMFDPLLCYNSDHLASMPRNTEIDLLPIPSQIAANLNATSVFNEMIDYETEKFSAALRNISDKDIFFFATLAAISLISPCEFPYRHSAIRFIAANTGNGPCSFIRSVPALSSMVRARTVHFPDMFTVRKKEIMSMGIFASEPFREIEFVCFTDKEIQTYFDNPDCFYLSGRARHPGICQYCNMRLAEGGKKENIQLDEIFHHPAKSMLIC